MGGLGSGRWGWHHKKVRAESCRWFTVAMLVGDQPPAAGRAAKLVWKDASGAEAVSVAFTFATAHTPVLAYRWGDPPKEYGYPLDLVGLPTPNGGTRYLARCPLTMNGVRCTRRVAKLFRPPRSPYFGCRHCHRLTYRSRQAHDPRISALLRGGLNRLFEMAERPDRLPVTMLGRVLFAIEEWRHSSDKAMKRLDPKPPPRRRKTK